MTAEILDDHHTVDEGALKRFLKMRKWMVLSAGALFLIDSGLLQYQDLVRTLYVSELPKNVVHFSLTLTAAYQLVMGVLVDVQLVAQYPDSLRGRLGLERWDIAKDIDNHLDQTTEEIAALNKSFKEKGGEQKKHDQALRGLESVYIREHARVKKIRREYLLVGWPEVIIDLMRILPANIVLIVALWLHGHWTPTP